MCILHLFFICLNIVIKILNIKFSKKILVYNYVKTFKQKQPSVDWLIWLNAMLYGLKVLLRKNPFLFFGQYELVLTHLQSASPFGNKWKHIVEQEKSVKSQLLILLAHLLSWIFGSILFFSKKLLIWTAFLLNLYYISFKSVQMFKKNVILLFKNGFFQRLFLSLFTVIYRNNRLNSDLT